MSDPSSQPTQPLTDAELDAAKARARLAKECQNSHLGAMACRAAIRDSVCANGHMQHRSRAEVDAYRDREALLAEVDRLRTWDGLMSVLDKYLPEDIWPTREDDPSREPGPRIVSLLRWNIRLRRELAEMETDRDKYRNWYDNACEDLAEAYRSRNEED